MKHRGGTQQKQRVETPGDPWGVNKTQLEYWSKRKQPV